MVRRYLDRVVNSLSQRWKKKRSSCGISEAFSLRSPVRVVHIGLIYATQHRKLRNEFPRDLSFLSRRFHRKCAYISHVVSVQCILTEYTFPSPRWRNLTVTKVLNSTLVLLTSRKLEPLVVTWFRGESKSDRKNDRLVFRSSRKLALNGIWNGAWCRWASAELLA